MMKEWFEENPQSKTRWGRWFDLSLKLWREFLDEGFVAPTWASGVLVNELNFDEVWSRPLIVDLGAELTQVEADLLILLSRSVDVTVLCPEPEWKADYAKTLSAYEILARRAKDARVAPLPQSAAAQTSQIQFLKFTTMIAEVKEATARVRQWLSETKSATKVAIVAPDIEAYWPALSSYLAQEGIPVQKDEVRRLHDFPDVCLWLAGLRLRSGSHSEADIEVALFESNRTDSRRSISYDRFKILYSAVYGREDLERHDQVARRFELELQPGDQSSRDDFIAWTLKHLPEHAEFARFESLFKRIFAECPSSMKFSTRRWMTYLERLAAKLECRVRDGDPDGIACINISSAENSPAEKMIVLGLTESALRTSSGTGVLFQDVSNLAREFGFHLASEDQAKLEFEARWISDASDRELILTVPETDFGGSVQAASWLWVKGAREREQQDILTIPQTTRWDEIQRSPLGVIGRVRCWPAPQSDYIESSLGEDLALLKAAPFAKGDVKSLSPSGIEDYLKCPFIFAAKRIFSLSDVSELELEVDASRRGSLMHKIFELLTEEPVNLERSGAEIETIVDLAKEEAKLELADIRLWPPLRARYAELARRFLALEKENRGRFSETQTVGRELEIAGYLNPETGELLREPVPGALKFVGRIDRVDADDHGNFAIFDYKSSAGSVSQFGSWLKNNRIQLLLYAMAIEEGLTALPPAPVMAALYYVAKPLERDTGFKVDTTDQGLYETIDKRKRNRISDDEKAALFTEGRELLKKAAQGIIAGEFRPEPRDSNECLNCQWSAVCRAPHMNT
jgi:ATP-dependent helicase/nuclease subunit B